MNNSNESHKVVRQNDQTVKKSQKHDVNLQKNTTLYFQIGLIMCLLASYTALEMTFATTVSEYAEAKTDDLEDVNYSMDKFKIEEVVVEEKVKVKVEATKPTIITDEIEVVKDDEILKEALNLTTDPPTVDESQVLNDDDDSLVVEAIEEPVNIMAVQVVPVYPGCESAKNNQERRDCMSEKLGKLIQKKFNGDLGADLGLKGKQKIYVSFKIDKSGNVVILQTSAPHPKLKKEANRVVSKIPTMQPGKNDKKPVEVLYTLPITFNVQNY